MGRMPKTIGLTGASQPLLNLEKWSSPRIIILAAALAHCQSTFLGHLLKHRMRSCSWSQRGLPGRLDLLRDAKEGQALCDELKEQSDLWEKAKKQPGAWWAKLSSQSCFNLLVVEKACAMAKAVPITVTATRAFAIHTLAAFIETAARHPIAIVFFFCGNMVQNGLNQRSCFATMQRGCA